MPWPTPQEYNEAIQNLAQNVVDRELRAGSAEVTALGLPRPITGNFASVYRISCTSRDFAVRCFWREYADIPERYAAISRHLAAARLPYTVGFDYQEQGIRIRGSWFPLLKMEWVRGALLDEYVRSHLQDPAALRELAAEWVEMIGALERNGIAHGDLQHGNVLVTDAGLKLVDYDAMYVPALAGRGSHEVGHQHYQHPQRTGDHFGPRTDRFSAWVVYLSLCVLATVPDLWNELRGGDECLLFRRHDFLNPQSSDALRFVLERGDVRLQSLARSFVRAIAQPPERTPPLVEGLAFRRGGRGAVPSQRPRHPAWLTDHLPRPEPFRPSVRVPRLCIALALPTLIGGAGVAAFVAGPLMLGIAILVTAFDAAIVVAWFRGERAVRERGALRRQQRARRFACRRAAHRIDVLERRVDRLAARSSRREARELQRLETDTERARVDRELARSLLANRLATIDESLLAIDELESRDLAAALEGYQGRHVTRALRAHPILTADITGVGLVCKARAWVMGVRSARDVTSEKITRLRPLGSGVVEAIVGWRLDAEVEARRRLPTELPDAARNRVIGQYVGGRRRAERERAEALASERRLDGAIGIWLDRRVAVHQARLADHKRRCDERAAALTEDLEAARGAQDTAQTQLEEVRAELAMYGDVGFTRYLRAVLGG